MTISRIAMTTMIVWRILMILIENSNHNNNKSGDNSSSNKERVTMGEA